VTFQVDPGSTAEDVVHETLVSFLDRWSDLIGKIDSGQAAIAYLKAACRNKLVDQYRHRRNATQLLDFLTLKFREAFETQTEAHKSLFIKEIIKLLPLECAQLLTDYVTEDLSLAELAEQKDLTPAALYARWYRCIERAREIVLQRKAVEKR
jgi:RNA polymerase sigma factor (sigma-70 family)